MDLGSTMNNIDPGTGNSGIGGGEQNPTPGSEASILGHNLKSNSDQESNFQSNNHTFKDARVQGDMVAQEHMTQDNVVAQKHMTQDNVVAQEHTTRDNMVAQQHNNQDITQNKTVFEQYGEESWVADFISSAAKARSVPVDKKVKGFRRSRYADRTEKGYKCHKK